MKKYFVIVLIFLSGLLFSQELDTEEIVTAEKVDTDITQEFYTENTIISANKINYLYPEYPATPGDVYDIVYILPSVNTSNTIAGFVDINYNIDLSFIGTVNVKGLTYVQVQDVLKKRLIKAYPGSIVNVIIKSTGLFKVTLLGEVTKSHEVDAMSLTTLEQIIAGRTTNYASYRDIEIRSEDGSVKVYDLFKFRRYADKKNNPYLKPNDVITLRPYKKSVTITGQVKRPGNYQLLPNDTLQDVITVYADGYTKIAEISKLLIQKKLGKNENFEDRNILINGVDQNLSLINLEDFDLITVPAKTSYNSNVTITGEVNKPGNYELIKGSTLEDLIYIYGDEFTNFADTSRIILRRKINPSGTVELETKIINLENDDLKSIILRDYDSVIIPSIFTETKNVVLAGQSKKTGEFVLSDGDTLYDLIYVYGYGFKEFADTTRISIRSQIDDNGIALTERENSIINAEEDDLNSIYLNDFDYVFIPQVRMEQRVVTISGQVKSPGNYAIADGDTLYDLIEIYGYGFTKFAETSKIEIQRVIGDDDKYSESTLYIDSSIQDLKGIKLNDRDSVFIPNIVTYSPFVTFQGAVSPSKAEQQTANENGLTVTNGTSVSNRITVPIIKGNRLSTAISKLKGEFNLTSDLEHAFILRGNEKIEVDIKDVLTNINSKFDIEVQDKDIVIIPFRQLKVFIAGSVNNPGSVPFIENRTASYYIGLAGGFNQKENLFGSYSIRDVYGKKVKGDAIISPEDSIWVNKDHPMAYVEQYAGWITTIISTAFVSTQLAELIIKLNTPATNTNTTTGGG